MEKPSNILILKSGKTTKRIAHSELGHVCCDEYVCNLHFADGTKHTFTKPLSFFEETLPEADFFRISHGVIVAFRHTKEVVTLGRRLHNAVMNDGSVFPIASRRWKAFKERYHGK